jgi:RND family efflux transporter MFP subunit
VILGQNGADESGGRYEFAQIERGDLENVVSATGTLSPVGTIEVGTQVSGTIDDVLVDYNQPVSQGQVLAVLDTTLLAASLRDARANLLQAQAQHDKAQNDLRRAQDLFDQGHVSESDIEDARTSAMSARASYVSAQAGLERSEANLGYAVIRSPIDGTVIMRSVEAGQTVAASFSTPTLFIIAEDLADMEIHALVDESDIGQIREGQHVRFTVEAYLDEMFEGEVRQVWLQPETIQNVVNYTVVVDASNRGGLLYPGMTATIDFLIDERKGVLLVPNTALRFQPSMAMFAELRARMEEQGASAPGQRPGAGRGAQQVSTGDLAAQGHAAGGSGAPDNGVARLWHLDEDGRISVARVRTGASDGLKTEIVEGPDVHEGMEVITAVNETEEDDGGSRNPLATGPFGRGRH